MFQPTRSTTHKRLGRGTKISNAATYASSGAMRRLGRQRQQAASSTSTISGRTIYGNTISPMSTARRRSGPNLRCVLANDIAATRWRICHADRLVRQLHAQKNGDLVDRRSCSSDRSVAHTARCVDQQVNSLPRRSPMITHGAMVLPVVTRGMMEASAIRNPSMPYTRSCASTTDIASRPIFAVHD